MKHTVLVLVLLAGCASAPAHLTESPKPPPEPGSAVDDATLMQAYVQQQQAQTDELLHPTAGPRQADCGQACRLAWNICTLSGQICAVGARHEGDADLERTCNDALDRCSRARAVVQSDACNCNGT